MSHKEHRALKVAKHSQVFWIQKVSLGLTYYGVHKVRLGLIKLSWGLRKEHRACKLMNTGIIMEFRAHEGAFDSQCEVRAQRYTHPPLLPHHSCQWYMVYWVMRRLALRQGTHTDGQDRHGYNSVCGPRKSSLLTWILVEAWCFSTTK